MPSFSSKVQLSTSAKNSNIVLADVDRIKGAFKIYTTAESMNSNEFYYIEDNIKLKKIEGDQKLSKKQQKKLLKKAEKKKNKKNIS